MFKSSVSELLTGSISSRMVGRLNLLEIVLGGRECHSLIVVGKKRFPSIFAEYLICKN